LNTIKLHIKISISLVLITTVLLPFAIQFSHAFTSHEYSICQAQNKTHIDLHEIDCSVFHFKINNNTVEFSSNQLHASTNLVETKIFTTDAKTSSVKFHFKLSRAPPFLLT
tara:strand:+ start:13875 stop:14207 length:333 start_codon:yes stop_codon:yes gene_type:complete